MYTKGNNLNEVAERLTNAIIEDNVLIKEKLIPRCRTILKAWVNANDRPINYDNIKTDKGILVRTLEKRDIENQYWKDRMRELVDQDGMKNLYAQLNKDLKSKGYL